MYGYAWARRSYNNPRGLTSSWPVFERLWGFRPGLAIILFLLPHSRGSGSYYQGGPWTRSYPSSRVKVPGNAAWLAKDWSMAEKYKEVKDRCQGISSFLGGVIGLGCEATLAIMDYCSQIAAICHRRGRFNRCTSESASSGVVSSSTRESDCDTRQHQ